LLTQIYCEEQIKNTDKSDAEILRSINLVSNDKRFFSFLPGSFDRIKWEIHPYEDDAYPFLFEEQMQQKRKLVKPEKSVFEGRILVLEIDSVITDGASETETKGFIDEYDCPPIDTWFYLIQGNVGRTLYAWIPQPFISIVQVGIDVNAMDLFKWQNDKVDVQVKETIRRRLYPEIDFNLKQPISEKHYWIRIGIILLLWLIMYVFRKY